MLRRTAMGNAAANRCATCPCQAKVEETFNDFVPSFSALSPGLTQVPTTVFDNREVVYADGSRYIGQMVGDMRHGAGRQLSSEWAYNGQWRMDKQDGRGELSWDNGNRYEGQFVDNQFSGHGHMHWQEEDMSYEGQYVADLKHGHGTFRWADGRTYVGEWVQGMRWGKAVVTEKDGQQREAMWEKDVRARPDSGSGAECFENSMTLPEDTSQLPVVEPCIPQPGCRMVCWNPLEPDVGPQQAGQGPRGQGPQGRGSRGMAALRGAEAVASFQHIVVHREQFEQSLGLAAGAVPDDHGESTGRQPGSPRVRPLAFVPSKGRAIAGSQNAHEATSPTRTPLALANAFHGSPPISVPPPGLTKLLQGETPANVYHSSPPKGVPPLGLAKLLHGETPSRTPLGLANKCSMGTPSSIPPLGHADQILAGDCTIVDSPVLAYAETGGTDTGRSEGPSATNYTPSPFRGRGRARSKNQQRRL